MPEDMGATGRFLLAWRRDVLPGHTTAKRKKTILKDNTKILEDGREAIDRIKPELDEVRLQLGVQRGEEARLLGIFNEENRARKADVDKKRMYEGKLVRDYFEQEQRVGELKRQIASFEETRKSIEDAKRSIPSYDEAVRQAGAARSKCDEEFRSTQSLYAKTEAAIKDMSDRVQIKADPAPVIAKLMEGRALYE